MTAPVRQNLYRKYRPQCFSELYGQEHISKTLQSAVAFDRISHAYLFSGPRGTGKTSAARLLAKILNCQTHIVADGIPDCCCECSNCKRIENMNFLDIIEIDAASNNGVEDIRQMRDNTKYRPAEGKYKIYIIDEVHMLSGSAFNAFLKTLEEPPTNVIFVLATTDPQKVPATIISRCQCFDFHSVSRRTIYARLEEIVKLETSEGNFPEFEKEALSMIAECAQGGFRDALSLLDQIASSTTDKLVRLDDVLRLTRRLSYSTLKDISAAIFSKNMSSLVMGLNELFSLGYEPLTIGRDLLEYLRRCMILKIDGTANQVLDLPTEQVDEIKSQIEPLVIKYLIGVVTRVERALITIKNSLQARVLLESELIRLAFGDEIFSNEALEKRIELLEQKVAALRKIALRQVAIASEMPVPTPSHHRAASPLHRHTTSQSFSPTQRESSGVSSEDITPIIEKQSGFVRDFKSAVGRRSTICQALLVNSRIEKPSGAEFSIIIEQSFAAGKLKEPKNIQILLEAAKEVLDTEISTIRILLPEQALSGITPAIPARKFQEEIARIDDQARKKLLKSPSIAEAIDVFGGEVLSIDE